MQENQRVDPPLTRKHFSAPRSDAALWVTSPKQSSDSSKPLVKDGDKTLSNFSTLRVSRFLSGESGEDLARDDRDDGRGASASALVEW